MSSNITTNERSMNGIISINADDLKVNTLDATNINVENLEIENSLLVNTTTLSPSEIEQLTGVSTLKTIQQQLDDKVTKLNVNQEINGNKTFLNQLQLNNGILVDNINISNFELKQLDGVTSKIQDQLDNKVDLTNSQLIGGNKTFKDNVILKDDLITVYEDENQTEISTNISNLELSYLSGVTSNIQEQFNLITTGEQTFTGNKTFTGDISLNGNLLVADINNNTKTISPLELSYLDGLTVNVQEALEDAGVANAVNTNKPQTITGQKIFTQPVGLNSVVYSNQTGTIYGFKFEENKIFEVLTNGFYSVGVSVINGIDAETILESVEIEFGDVRLFNLLESQPINPSFKTTKGYVNDNEDRIILLNAEGIIASTPENIPEVLPSGLIFPRWTGTTYVNTPDWVLNINNTEIELADEFFNYYNLVKQKSTFSGFLKTSNQIVKNPNDTAILNSFIEETNLSVPTEILSIDGNLLNISSTNTPATSVGLASGYFTTSNTFYNYNNNGLLVDRFISGNNDDGSLIASVDTNFFTCSNNTYVTPIAFTRTGYIDTNQTIIIKDTTDIVLNQAVKQTDITEGLNFITNISNNEITLGTNAISNIPSRNNYNGYLISNSELVTDGTFNVNYFISHPDIGSKITQIQGQIGQVVTLNETSSITPTPNNKTYNGFSINSTTFFYRDDNTNVGDNYYLKDNSITIPTVNHLITDFSTVEKSLTTQNLQQTIITNQYFGYANINLNQIITNSPHDVIVNDGIYSIMNSGIRFVSGISPEYYEGISVYGSLVFKERQRATTGICIGEGECLVYDPNNILTNNYFLVDYDNPGLIPPDCKISLIESIGLDFYRVGLSSQGGFTENSKTRYTEAFRPDPNILVINNISLNNKIYQLISNNSYRYITDQTTNLRVYDTNDTVTDFNFNNGEVINIITSNNDNRVLLLTEKYNGQTQFLNKYLNSTLIPNGSMTKTASSQQDSMNYSVNLTIEDTINYLDFNYGNKTTNPYTLGGFYELNPTVSTGNSYIYEVGFNDIFVLVAYQDGFISGLEDNPYAPVTGDIIIDTTGTDTSQSLKAKESLFTGMRVNMEYGSNQEGNAPILDFIPPSNRYFPTRINETNRRRFLSQFYPPAPTIRLIFNEDSTIGAFIILAIQNFSIQLARIIDVRPINFQGTIRYEYFLDREVRPYSPALPWIEIPTLPFVYIQYGTNAVFNSVKFRPSLLTTGINFYNPLTLDVPDNQSNYEIVQPSFIGIYNSLDSYNSYEKTTFQEIVPINDFQFINTETVNFYENVTYNQFEGFEINFFTTNEYLINSTINLSFPTLTDDDKFVLRDAFEILENKFARDFNLLDNVGFPPKMYIEQENGLECYIYPFGSTGIDSIFKFFGNGDMKLKGELTLGNTGIQGCPVLNGVIRMVGTTNAIYYDNNFKVQGANAFKSTNNILIGGLIDGVDYGYNRKLIIGDSNWTFGVDNGVRGLNSNQYFPTISFYGDNYDNKKIRFYNAFTADTIFQVDKDGNTELGRTTQSGCWLGYVGYSGYMGIQHSSFPRTGGNYALLQARADFGGHTYLNCASTGTIYFRRNNSTYMFIDAFSLKISTAGISYPGTTIGNQGKNQIGLVWGNSRIYGGVDNVAFVELGVWSDRRTKKNIVDYSNGIEDIMKLRPRKYNIIKIDTEKCDLSGDNCIIKDCSGHELHFDSSGNCIDECCEIGDENVGLILDEVREHFPEYCQGGDENSLGSVSYLNMVPMLIQAVQDQQKQINELKEQINKLL